MKKSKLLLVLTMLICIFVACEDDKEEDKPYFGTWVSNTYMSQDLTTGEYIWEKMTFNFTNTTFTDAIAQSSSLEDTDVQAQVTIGGSIDNSEGTTLNVVINSILLFNGASAEKDQDETTFNTLFQGSVGPLLYDEFEATYTLYSDGDSMKLELPVKINGPTTTIRLGKQ